jgi:hypothetical protein
VAIEPYQQAGWDALTGPARSVMLFGGSRSGKTYLILLWIMLRALKAPMATHAILRLHFNHIKASIIDDTLPTLCRNRWPGEQMYTLNRTDWVATVKGGGRIYFGGLDDKERTEKILGQGHSTIFLNETSQISYESYLKATTRVSQDCGLQLKDVCDENPPLEGHWTHRLWVKGRNPGDGKPVANLRNFASVRMNPEDNPHIPESYKARLRDLPPNERRRFWEGQWGSGTANPLWTYDSLNVSRVEAAPRLGRIVVAVDPSGCHGPEDKRSDEVGLSVCGLGEDGALYVLEDASGRMGPQGAQGWGAKAIALYHKWAADNIVCETNFGGAMVTATISVIDANVPVREVTASRGKHVRAEPVAQLFSSADGTKSPKAFLVGYWPELEAQLVQFSSAGYQGDKSPDRADAMVWGAYALGVVSTPGQGYLDALAAKAAKYREPQPSNVTVTDADLVLMRAPAAFAKPCQYQAQSGRNYYVEDGHIRADPRDVAILIAAGFSTVSSAA